MSVESRKKRVQSGSDLRTQNLLTQATEHHQQGEFSSALETYKKIIAHQPSNAQALSMAGIAALQLGDPDEAVRYLTASLSFAPENWMALNNLGSAYHEKGDLDSARDAYERALLLNPEYENACYNMGKIHQQLEEYDEAENAFLKALSLRPDYVEALGCLADLYEKTNRLEDASAMAKRGLRIASNDAILNLVAARCCRRKNKLDVAFKKLVDYKNLTGYGTLAEEINFELGYLYDRNGEYEKAFTHFSAGNEIAMLNCLENKSEINKDHYLKKIEELTSFMHRASSDTPTGLAESDTAPVFLIGFPRSGTTLLNQILDSHPSIQTLEERPTILSLEKAISDFPKGMPEALVDLTPENVQDLRSIYFQTASQFMEIKPGSVFIDKFPLHITDIPLISRVFYNAKYLLALRHPYDVCLSCFMQSFELNNAMANFMTLEDTANLYIKVMNLWLLCKSKLHINNITVKYENVINNIEDESRKLLDFINVDFDKEVLNFYKNALYSKNINTPSYNQVTKPIYNSSLNRWKKYDKYLKNIKPILSPYLEHFDYENA